MRVYQGDSPSLPIGDPALVQDVCRDTVGCFSRLHRAYGPIVGYRQGPDLTVFAFSPEANYTVFTDNQTYFIVGPPGPRGSSQRRFQQGLFGLNGQQQMAHRRMLAPPLSKSAVCQQARAMHQIVEDYLGGWQIGKEFDLYASMKELSLTVAAKLLFGLDASEEVRAVAPTFQEWLDCYIAVFFEMLLPVTAPEGTYERLLSTAERLEKHFRELIRLRESTLTDEDGDLLAILLRARRENRITDTEVIGEMQTLLNASYQTTASGLTWSLLLLAQHPEVMRELYAELRSSSHSMMDERSLLSRSVKESLRLAPPVVFPLRQMAAAGTLLGHELPRGTYVVVSYYVSHHLEETFAQPQRYLPDRWLQGNVSPYAYLPFSIGPRMCMGTMFAQQFLRMVVAAVTRRFRLVLEPGQRVDRHANLTIGIRGGLPVRVVPQDGRFSSVPLTGDIHEMVDLPSPAVERIAA